MSANEQQRLEAIEETLASNVPFGDWRYVDDCTWARYERRVEMLTTHLPDVKPLLAAMKAASPECRFRVMGDPVFRATVNDTLGALELKSPGLSLERPMAIFTEATRYLREDRRTSPLSAGAHRKISLGAAPHLGWIWCDEREEDAWGQSLRELFSREPASAVSVLRTPDENTLSVLRRSVAILEDLLPRVTRSALDHAHLVAVTDVLDRQAWSNAKRRFPYESFSTRVIPGAAILCMGVLRNPYKAAEHLLHEALHLKWYDLQHTHAIFRKGYQAEESVRLRSLWNRSLPGNTNEWPVCRAIAAAHVYVHLSLYWMQMERRLKEIEARHGSLDGYDPSRLKLQGFERARYLALTVRKMGGGELRIGGQRMVDWLLEMLEQLGAGPEPEDDGVHLLLDLYEREMSGFQVIIDTMPSEGRPGAGSARRQLVWDMLRSEVDTAGRIASTLGSTGWRQPEAVDPARDAAERLRRASDPELVRTFQATRNAVAGLLRSVPPEQFSRVREPETQKPLSQLVQEMVESSSGHITVLSAGGPYPQPERVPA